MAQITLRENTITTYGNLPITGEKAPYFELIATDMSKVNLYDFKGKRVIMNIFPSIDTNIGATSVRSFNERAIQLNNTVVLCISRDLPFTLKRFLDIEGLNKVTNLSDFRQGDFGKDYGVEMMDGPLEGLLSRVVIVLDESGKVMHSQQVSDISEEPDYLAALKSLL